MLGTALTHSVFTGFAIAAQLLPAGTLHAQPREVLVNVSFLDQAGEPVPSVAFALRVCSEEDEWVTAVTDADGRGSTTIAVCEGESLLYAQIYASRFNDLPDRHTGFLAARAVLQEQAVAARHPINILPDSNEATLVIQAQPARVVSGTLAYSDPKQAWGFVAPIGWKGVAEADPTGVFTLQGVPVEGTTWLTVGRIEWYDSLIRIDSDETSDQLNLGEIPNCTIEDGGTLYVRALNKDRYDNPVMGFAAGPMVISEDMRFLVEGQTLETGNVCFGYSDSDQALPLPVGRYYILPASRGYTVDLNTVLTAIADRHADISALPTVEILADQDTMVTIDYGLELPKLREFVHQQ